MRSADWRLLLLSLAFVQIGIVFRAVRWGVLLNAQDLRIPLTRLIGLYYVGHLLFQCAARRLWRRSRTRVRVEPPGDVRHSRGLHRTLGAIAGSASVLCAGCGDAPLELADGAAGRDGDNAGVGQWHRARTRCGAQSPRRRPGAAPVAVTWPPAFCDTNESCAMRPSDIARVLGRAGLAPGAQPQSCGRAGLRGCES